LDGMAWLHELARDKTLKDEWRWYAVKKFKGEGGQRERFIDEPLSGQEAWEYVSNLNFRSSKVSPVSPECPEFDGGSAITSDMKQIKNTTRRTVTLSRQPSQMSWQVAQLPY